VGQKREIPEGASGHENFESKKQKDNQTVAKPLTITISKPLISLMMINEEHKSNPFGPEYLVEALKGGIIDPDNIDTKANSEVEVLVHMMHVADETADDKSKIPPIEQKTAGGEWYYPEYSLFLGKVFPLPGILLTNGKDFIIREIRDFEVSGMKMLLFLATGKPIKTTDGIHIVWAGQNILIDTTGNGTATYQILGNTVREFVAIKYPDLNTVCEHITQSWCYMKNSGKLCIRIHMEQDGEGLCFV
jgi:hypothetical protein